MKPSILRCFWGTKEETKQAVFASAKKDMKKKSKRMAIQKVSLNLHAKRNVN